MAAASIITTGSGAATSADVVVTSTVAFALKNFASDAIVDVYLKDDAGAYHRIGSITSDNPSKQISAPGTYQFVRPARSGSCGLFSG